MRKITMALVAGVLFVSCQSEEKKVPVYTDLFIENLKGEVTTVESTPYKTDSTGNTGEMDSCCISTSEFDSKGYIVKAIQKDKSGKVTSEETYTHFDNGHMKEMEEKKDGKTTGKLSIGIDSAGKYVSGEHFDSSAKKDLYYDGLTEDMYGNVLTGKQYNADGVLKSTWKNNFKEQLFTGGENTDSTGKIVWKSTATLNEKGDRVEWNTTEIKADSTINKSFTYKYDNYDEQGNWIQRTELENGKPIKVTKRTITYAKKE